MVETGCHSYHRRAFAHNYFAPFIYHIILKKQRHCEAFGTVAGDARIEYGKPGCAYIKESQLGMAVAKAIVHSGYEYPILKLHQYCVMPDHAHILLEVQEWSDQHLDFYIEKIKETAAKKYSLSGNRIYTKEEIFEAGYCDKPLLRDISLSGWYKYIRLNPHRLALRMQYPQFFQRVHKLKIDEKELEAYGNLSMLRNPDKMAVKISSKYTEEERVAKENQWLENAARGSVLISPFISTAEKQIREEAEKLGAPIILIKHEAFPERYRPSAHDFELCAQGKLLILSLGKEEKRNLTRGMCMEMNALAAKIAKGGVRVW